MGKRILIPGLILLLLAAGVGAWLVLNLPGQGKGGGASASESGTPILGVSGGTPESTAHRQDADATSAQPGSRAGHKGDAAGSKDGRADVNGGARTGSGAWAGNSGVASGNSKSGSPATDQSAGKPERSKERSKIIDATRPPNQTLGNARPVSRAIKTPVAKKLEDVSEKLKQDRRGLYAQYYAFHSEPLAELAKEDAKTLAQRDAALVRIDNQVHFPNNEAFADLPFSLANFAAAWDGYLVIPEQGEYWLFLGADNAARVDLDGETVLLNDVQSRYIEVSTVLELAPGLHPLHIEFAQGMLANEDSWRCAASFMWVPKGAQKPIAVPPEMLMVPQWMWSDDAPIITKLSKYEGEIGDEIVIYGQGLNEEIVRNDLNERWSDFQLGAPNVYFNGQLAKVIESSDREIRVRLPIGASSGRLVVVRMIFHEGVWPEGHASGSGVSERRSVPSNSVDFKVTTQFGLMAHWYDLSTGSTETFVEPGSREPDVARIENSPFVVARRDLDLAFKDSSFAGHWEGFVGIPDLSESHVLRVYSSGKVRAAVGSVKKDYKTAEKDGWGCFQLDFELDAGGERKLPLTIDWICAETEVESVFSVYLISATNLQKADYPLYALNSRWFFPPVTPPKPPRIASARAIAPATNESPEPPFPASVLPSIREDQEFSISVEIFGDEEVQSSPVSLFADGLPVVSGTGTLVKDTATGRVFRKFIATLPFGCGEGKLTAKLGLSTSEPFYIDVANKGLIAYLYDLPNPSGYAQFPNILPLTCHTIRKEREINFGTADSFNLPFVAETFAVEWYGAVIIESDGWYTFTSRTDDGCRVWLNGIEIIDDDNLHAPQEKSSERIRLVAGTYPFRMQFFENNQHEECLLFVSATDMQEKETLPKQVVPKRMFTWEVHDSLPDKIATGKKADGSE